jgi:hypothetical protein
MAAEAKVKPPACFIVGHVVDVLAKDVASKEMSQLTSGHTAAVTLAANASNLDDAAAAFCRPPQTVVPIDRAPTIQTADVAITQPMPRIERTRRASCSDAHDATGMNDNVSPENNQRQVLSVPARCMRKSAQRTTWEEFIEHSLSRPTFYIGTCLQ